MDEFPLSLNDPLAVRHMTVRSFEMLRQHRLI